MTRWQFVGRTTELEHLLRAATDRGRGGVVVTGDEGVGKSRLLREAVLALDGERVAVWTATAHAATAGLPLGSLAHALPSEQPTGLTPAGLLRWALDALADRAAGRPVVFAIDDLHHVDPLSAALIYGAVRAGRSTLLASLRTGEPVPDPVAALWKEDLAERIELTPLSVAEVGTLLGHALGGPVEPAMVARLHRLSQGNALLLRELVLTARASGDIAPAYGQWRVTGRLTLAPTLVELVETRLGDLTDDVRTVVELVALGEPLGLRLLTAASAAGAVERAEERQLIRVEHDDRRVSVRLAHPLYGEVVRRRCPVTRTRRHQARLADLFEGTGLRRRDDVLRAVVWRLESRTPTDPARLLAAGRLALARFDTTLAARLVRAAVEDGGGFDAGELLAAVLTLAGRPDEALAALDGVAAAATTSAERARWQSTRAVIRYYGLGAVEAMDELALVAATIDDPGDRTWLTAAEAMMRCHHGDCEEALRLGRSVLDRPAASPAARAVARSAIAHVLAVRGSGAQASRMLAAVDADAAQWRPDDASVQLPRELARGTVLILGAHLTEVDALVAGELADVDPGDLRVESGYLSVVLGQAARLRGRLGAALRHQRTACGELAGRPYVALAHAERAHCAALRGDAREARQALADADAAMTPTLGILRPWLEHARYWTRAASGDLAGAVRGAIELAARARADTMHRHEAMALYDLVRLGRAEAGAPRLADLALQLDGPHTSVMAAHARAATHRDAAGLLAVAHRFEALGLTLFAAEAAAGAVNRMHQTRSARLVEASRLHATLRARCDGADTPGLAVRRPALTGREAEIAQLAADGCTSRAIADGLYLSARTVDNHLRRVYAKLGISGRGELAPALKDLVE